jgi:hypothetical protein
VIVRHVAFIRGLIDATSSRQRKARWRPTWSAAGRAQTNPGAQDTGLQIELRGNLAAMLTMASRLRAREVGRASARFAADLADGKNATRSPDNGDLESQIAIVAGARNRLYRQLCWAAA